MTADDDLPEPEPTIPLEGFLKREGVFPTGGQAKRAIQDGEVSVNGTIETRRKKKLRAGDVVQTGDVELIVDDVARAP